MWTRMLRQGDYWRYSIRHAIDTSHVEGTFLLHPEVRSCPSERVLVLKRV